MGCANSIRVTFRMLGLPNLQAKPSQRTPQGPASLHQETVQTQQRRRRDDKRPPTRARQETAGGGEDDSIGGL